MKKYITEIIKDIIISTLIIICILLILSIALYNKISLTKIIPETESHFLTEEMQEEVKKSNLEQVEEVVVNYYIDATDLKKYEKTNEYVKGKSYPFAKTSEYITDDEQNNNVTNSNNNSNGFFEDDGTK